MKNYELVELTSLIFCIKATEGEKESWIPTDSSNKDYAEYLRYTAWVEAGNSPEDFWVAEGNEPEVINNEVG